KTIGCIAALGVSVGSAAAQALSTPAPQSSDVYVVEVEGPVQVSRVKAGIWDRAYTNQILYAGDRLRTLERGRALVHLPNLSPLRLGELSLLEMPPERKLGFNLLRGVIYFFDRDEPGTLPVQTPAVATLIRGTEFNLKVAENGVTTLTSSDGQVEMTNALGQVTLSSGEQGVAEPGQA